MGKIHCTTCGAQYDDTDEDRNYWFESDGSISVGDYSSPKLISDAGDSMTFCPRCDVRGLKDTSERMGRGEEQLRQRLKDERETAGSGDADVVHE